MWNKISFLIEPLFSIFILAKCAGCGAESQRLICPFCITHIQRIKPGNSLFSFGKYEGLFKEMIHHFKYENRFALAKPFADLMTELVPENTDCLIPVPLHFQKLRKRRYNPPALIANRLSKILSIPLYVDVLKKISPSTSQTGLSKTERKKNVEKTFRVAKPEKIADKRILLVDDVYTTGATTDECRRVLEKQGASDVKILTLARSERVIS